MDPFEREQRTKGSKGAAKGMDGEKRRQGDAERNV